MDSKFNIDKYQDKFFIFHDSATNYIDNKETTYDDAHAFLLRLNTAQYRKILTDNFNGYYSEQHREMCFDTSEHVKEAVDFLNQSWKLMSR